MKEKYTVLPHLRESGFGRKPENVGEIANSSTRKLKGKKERTREERKIESRGKSYLCTTFYV